MALGVAHLTTHHEDDMSNFSRDPILLTPGPLTTALPTRMAMLRDWGSWDSSFNAITAVVREQLLGIANAAATHVCVPMQGSGTFSVEASVNTLVPRDGHVLVLINGAYGKRFAKLALAPEDVAGVYFVATLPSERRPFSFK